jgi:hypothetical protein
VISATEPGTVLAERLGIESLGNEGHDLKAACVSCDSSDGFRIHREKGIAHCYVCQAKLSPLKLAETMLGDQRAAWDLLVDVGLEKPRQYGNGNGHAAPCDPVEAIARAKRIPLESFKTFGAKASAPNCVTLPAYGPDGAECTKFTLWTAGDETQLKGKFAGGKPAGLFFPHGPDGTVRLPRPNETWHVVEGPKDAAALHSLGLLACGLNTNCMAPKFARLFKAADVVLVPDRDAAGIDGAEKSARVLCGVPSSVKVASLPAPVLDKGGEDVRDVLRRDGGREQVLQAIADATEWKPPVDDRPDIVLGTDEARVADEAIAALCKAPNTYQRAGSLVQVVFDDVAPKGAKRSASAPRIARMAEALIRERAATVARFVTLIPDKKDGAFERVPAHPPMWMVKAIKAREQWSGIRRLEAVVEAPCLRADGSVLQTPGYDAESGILYVPNDSYSAIPEKPTSKDAIDAIAALLEVTADFPFESDEHRAADLASTLTPFARPAIAGPCPLMLVDANVRGSGKGLLMACKATICYGRPLATMPAPNNDEEFRKRITAVAVAGEPAVNLDNIVGPLGCASLDSALTSTIWTDRILGCNETITTPIYTIWHATGNNTILGADTARRTLHIRFNSPLENPEERADFRHPNLLKWVQANRPRLVCAALTILRAYVVAGRPDQGLPAWGSFEAWSDLVRQAIVWAGLPDPGATRAKLARDSDSEGNLLRLLLTGWEEIDEDGNGMLVSEVLARLTGDESATRWKPLREALGMMTGPKSGSLPTAKSLGMKLHHLRGKVSGGRCFRREDSRNGAIWMVCGSN